MTAKTGLALGLLILVVCVSPGRCDINDEMKAKELRYRNACGPVACYVALRQLGQTADLEELMKQTGWNETEGASFRRLKAALSGYRGVTVQAVRLTPEELLAAVSDNESAVLIPVKRLSTQAKDHVVTITGQNDGLFRVVDFPNLIHHLELETLPELWDGEAIVVRLSTFGLLQRHWQMLILPVCCSAWALVAGIRSLVVRVTQSSAGETH